MNCLVVEDSRLARQELVHQLSAMQVFGEIRAVANTNEALVEIADAVPDVIFLDIHLPGKSGFDLLETLDLVPRVIFTTAYDQYAIRSFEHNTIDYLLKPISPERLLQAVGKLQVGTMSEEKKSPDNKVFVRDGERCWFVPLGDIRLFESAGNYVRIYFDEHSPLIQKSLSALEAVLDENIFYRVNRQQMINLTYVQSIDTWFSDTLKVTLQTGEEIEVSRRQSARLKKLFSL